MPTYLQCPERAAPAQFRFLPAPSEPHPCSSVFGLPRRTRAAPFPAGPEWSAPAQFNFRPAPREPRCREHSRSSGGSYKASSLGLAGPGRQKERRPACTPHVQTLSALLSDYALTDNRKSAVKKLQLCLHYTIYWYIITIVSQNSTKMFFVVVCS